LSGTSPDSVSYADTPYGLLGPMVPGWINVQDFGADPTGNDIATKWIQAAADEVPDDGGVLLIPPGIYKCNGAVFLKSNTIVMAHGATFLTVPYAEFAVMSGFFPVRSIFSNVNFEATEPTDENIEIWGGTFDYRPMGTVPGGGAHALNFQHVRNVKVGHGTLYAGEDYIAARACNDVLVIGCSAYDFENCAWDFWWGCKNVRVIGCYSESNQAVQHANFQCSNIAYPSGQVADGFLLQGCQMVVTDGGFSYSSIFLDPFGTGNLTKNVIIQGNKFVKVIIAARGAVEDVLIQGNQFIASAASTAAPIVFSYTEDTNTPTRITVDNNTVINPTHASPSVGVFDLRGTNCRFTNNVITGSAYSVPAVLLGSGGLQFSNTVEGTYGANNVQSSSSRIVGSAGDGKGFGLRTAGGSAMRWFVQSDDQMVLYGVNAAGDASRLAAAWLQHSDNSVWSWGIEVRQNANHLRTVSNNLTATGTVRGDALTLTAQFNNVTTVASGTGARLINRENGELIVRVRNGGANALNVYPFNVTDQIDALGAGNPYVLAAGKVGTWCLTTSGQWYTVSVSP
jgi:hypothetical protein